MVLVNFCYIYLLFASNFYLADTLDARDCHGQAGELEKKCPKQQHIKSHRGCSLPLSFVTSVLWEMKDLAAYKYWGPNNWPMAYSLGYGPLDP